MQKSKQAARLLVAAMILLLPFEIAILVGLWPFLPLVGKAFAGMLVTCCVCGAVYVVALTWQRITAPRLIVEGEVVVMLLRDGQHKHLSAEHEAAKLLPQARTDVTEIPNVLSAEDKELIERSKVLALRYEQGMGMHAIEKELGIPYNKVRDWCNTADALRGKQ